MIKNIIKTLLLTCLFATLPFNVKSATPTFYIEHSSDVWNSCFGQIEWYWKPTYQPEYTLYHLNGNPCSAVTSSFGSDVNLNQYGIYLFRVRWVVGFDYDSHYLNNYYPNAFGAAGVWDPEDGDWIDRHLPIPPLPYGTERVVGTDYLIYAFPLSDGHRVLSAFLIKNVWGWKQNPDPVSGQFPVYTIAEIDAQLGTPCSYSP